jgi:putative ABC transport system permease protein
MLRATWGSTLVLTAVVAVTCAIVTSFAAGAHRTATTPERYLDSVGFAFDDEVIQQEGGLSRVDELRTLPGVAAAESWTFMFAGVMLPDSDELGAIAFSGSPLALGSRVISGRLPDPDVVTEFAATPSFVELMGAEPGDSFRLATYTQEQGAAGEFGRLPPAGPTLEATLVGVIDGPQTIEDPSPMAVFPYDLVTANPIGVSQSHILVRRADGVDSAEFQRQLASLPNSSGLSVIPAEAISSEMLKAIDTQSRGMWLLALTTAIAAIAVLGQVITRQIRLSLSERQQLTAIGFTDRQMLIETVSRASIPVVAGTLLAAVLSLPFSGRFPTGIARELEPSVGVLVMWKVLALSFIGLTIGILAWVSVAFVLARSQITRERPSTLIDGVARRAPNPAAGVGLRFAFTRARGERGSVRAALVAVLLTVGGLVGAITFGASVSRLIDEPARYGGNFDAAIGDNGGERIDPDLDADLRSDADVTSLVFYANSFGQVGSLTIPLGGMEAVRGPGTPPVVAGRLPVAEDELALGRSSADDLDVGVGDEIEVAGLTGTASFRVTGIAVIAGLGENEGVGEGGVVTMSGLARIDDNAQPTTAVVRFESGSQAIARYAATFSSAVSAEPYEPTVIRNIDRVRSIPYVLAIVLGLLAVLTIAHAMLTSVRARQRDFAVLRALGADRTFVARAVHCQATAFAIVPWLVGAPLGFIAGRTLFVRYAQGIGALDGTVVPVLVVVLVLVGVVALANIVATLPAHRARRSRPAIALQRE